MNIFVLTLGCPKNMVDSEYLQAELAGDSVRFVAEAEAADVVIINTCAFILPAQEEAIETILEVVELKKQRTVQQLYVTGCLPQRQLVELEQALPEVDGFFSQKDFGRIGRLLRKRLGISASQPKSRRVLQTPAHYAYLKIAEGCNNRCHYCTIPLIKGGYQSRPLAELMTEAQELVDRGVRELILVAQDTTYYGWDQGQQNLLQLLIRSLVKIEKLHWLRLLYAHPAHVDEELLRLFQAETKLCRYIDLPIQHISDRMLAAMGRPTTGAAIRNLIDRLRRNIPDLAIRTTVMVGYPGETTADFELLRDFLAETKFERLGIFKYYAEKGTRAAHLPHQIDENTKDERLEELQLLQADIAREKNIGFVGQTVSVLIDEPDETPNAYLGRTQWDSPGIDNVVHVTGELTCGQIYPVKIQAAAEYEMWGSVNSID
ncbi:MAG: 30S ribosomal protein S12 methylthiotransferase RimO [candidate division KSB1 bacterium]|nr:30S ribosomal protein S12 methylthiotransferase RimO [candidate division KSB1 bacterium]